MDPKQLTNLLVKRGLVERFTVDQQLSRLAAHETLADRLVHEGLVAETDLLRAVATETQTRFISSQRLNDLRVAREALARIPAADAEKHGVLPVAYDAASKSLSVLVVDPWRQKVLDELPSLLHMEQVAANIAMPQAVRDAIRRCYGLDKVITSEQSGPAGECPSCKEPYFDEQLDCARCGLLLNPNAPVDRTESRIVRALLALPSGVHRMLSREQIHEGPTRRGFVVNVREDHVPEVVAGVEIARSLSEFEALVVSSIDGTMSVAQLAEATGLMKVEMVSMVASLSERQMLKLKEPLPPAPAAPPPPPSTTRAEAPAVLVPPPPVVMGVPVPAPPKPGGRTQSPQVPSRPGVPAVSAAPPAPPVLAPSARTPSQGSPAPLPQPGQPGHRTPAMNRHLDPNVQMEASLQSALRLEKTGQIDGAISVLRTAISRAKNPAPLYNRLALVLLNQRGDVRQAEDLIRKAMKLEPDNQVYKTNLMKVFEFAATK